jgi:hypothetical protein
LAARRAYRPALLLTKENGLAMPTRKKNVILLRQGKHRLSSSAERTVPGGPPRLSPEIDAMLMIGDEHVLINQEMDENICFMTEFIEPV